MKEDNERIGPASLFQEKYLSSNAQIMLVGGAAGCVPAETEFLSDRGWVSISDYTAGDKVATFDPSNHSVSFEEPLEYVKLPSKTLKSIKGKCLEMVLSDEHRVVYWNDKKPNMQTLPFSEVLERHEKSKTKGWMGNIRTSFTGVTTNTSLDYTEGELRIQVSVHPKNKMKRFDSSWYKASDEQLKIIFD
jgi:hypothetical protein